MTEYINRKELLRIEKLLDTDILRASKTASNIYDQMIYDIEHIPAADVAEVRCGRWEEVDWVEPDGHGFGTVRTPKAGLRCNQCSNVFKKELLWKRNYCPACSAKMDLED